MIVDDSTIIRRHIEKSLQPMESIDIVTEAEDGIQAIEMFKQHQPDIIIMDITMPNMGGLKCIQAITTMDTDVSILVVSALSDKATGLKSLQYGAKGFICKPFHEQQLRLALEKVIKAKQKSSLTA